MNRVQRLQDMEALLAMGRSAPDDERLQRTCIDHLQRHAGMAGIPLITWLEEAFLASVRKQPATVVSSAEAVETPAAMSFECFSCGKTFPSQASLSGHGPAKCAGKKKGGDYGA